MHSDVMQSDVTRVIAPIELRQNMALFLLSDLG
jgi:hypothetical protein